MGRESNPKLNHNIELSKDTFLEIINCKVQLCPNCGSRIDGNNFYVFCVIKLCILAEKY
jgi:hypothetical protein